MTKLYDVTLVVDVIDDEESFARLAPEWDALLADSDADGLFLTQQWLFAWWKHLAAGCTLHLVLVRRGGELIALAPLSLRRGSFEHLPPVRALQFLGAGEAESDCLDLIVRRGHEVDAVRALSERLIDCGRALALMRMRPSGATAALVEHMRQRGWRVWQEPQETCPFVSLRGRSFEPYLAGLGPEHRCAFRRKLGRIEHRHTTHYELTRTEAQRRDAIATLFRLHELRWRPRGDAGAFATQALRDFHDEISKVALAAGWLRLWTLRLDGMAAAAVYGFLYRRTFYFYQSGFDPELARESVDMVLLGVAVRAAIEQGADELALLHQTEHHEARSASATRELLRFELYGPGTRGLLEREATALTRQARRVTRLALEMGRRAFAGARAVDHAEPG